MKKGCLLLILFLVLLIAHSGWCKEEEFMVTKVIDGDTIQLENGVTVRYLGIDAPELYKKKEGGEEFFARESERYNRKLVYMKKVRLEYDVERKDQHGRTLAYVFVKKTLVNAELVKLGYAKASVKPPNVKYRDLLIESQRTAMEQEKGLWQEKRKETESSYIGNKRTSSLHRPSCKYVEKIPEKQRIIFRNRQDAIKIGYIPCKHCKP